MKRRNEEKEVNGISKTTSQKSETVTKLADYNKIV